MKNNTKHTHIIILAIILIGCGTSKIPDDNVWKGTFETGIQGDQKAEVSFNFKKNDGMIIFPELTPLPLLIKDLNQKSDSVFFTISFRFGPALCKAVMNNDTIKGVMSMQNIPDSPFWLVSSNTSANIYHLPKPNKEEPVIITTYSQSEKEKDIKMRLEAILKKYELEPYIYTKQIMIQDSTIPHSHPILTLSTRDTSEALILSTFIHEQMHWYTLSKNNTFEDLMTEIKTMYPEVPIQLPEGGGSEKGTYMHIPINYLEYRHLKQVIGDDKALKVLEYLKTHHYTWIYETVEKDYEKLEALFEKHKLHITQ